jgi:hypothetical protein
MYTKKFWRPTKFCNIQGQYARPGLYEAYYLCKNKEKKMLGIDFWFVMIAITHKGNVTSNLRRIITENTTAPNFYDIIFPPAFKQLLDNTYL